MIMGNELLEGEQVRLTAPTKADLPLFARWFSNIDLLRLLGYAPVFPFTLQDEEQWFAGQHKDGNFNFAVRTLEKDELIGSGSLKHLHWQARHAELGINIGNPEFWGQGYGTDAIKVLLRYGFMEVNLNRIYLYVHSYNGRGIASYKKAGFTEEGRLRQENYQDGAYHDTVIMGILRREWEAQENGVS
jgi:RimJ/RimL family protein N-acetyltransferase